MVAVLSGFLAVATPWENGYTRRQLALGASISTANSYRYVTVGLLGILTLWAVWVFFGWVPVAGTLLLAAAALVTWLLAYGWIQRGVAEPRRRIAKSLRASCCPPRRSPTNSCGRHPQFESAQSKPSTRTPPPPHR